MSKFDYGNFIGDYEFAVNAEKYTEQEAVVLFNFERGGEVGIEKGQYTMTKGWVRHRAGVDEDYEPCVGCWVENEKKNTGCEAWIFGWNYKKVEVGK